MGTFLLKCFAFFSDQAKATLAEWKVDYTFDTSATVETLFKPPKDAKRPQEPFRKVETSVMDMVADLINGGYIKKA